MINDLEDLKVDTCQVDADGKTLETFNVPDADGQVVAGSCREDLDEELVSRYIAAVRETTPRLVNENDTDVLYYTGVVADRVGTELTVAGLYGVKGQNVCLARRVAGVRFGLFECRLSGCSRCR